MYVIKHFLTFFGLEKVIYLLNFAADRRKEEKERGKEIKTKFGQMNEKKKKRNKQNSVDSGSQPF